MVVVVAVEVEVLSQTPQVSQDLQASQVPQASMVAVVIMEEDKVTLMNNAPSYRQLQSVWSS